MDQIKKEKDNISIKSKKNEKIKIELEKSKEQNIRDLNLLTVENEKMKFVLSEYSNRVRSIQNDIKSLEKELINLNIQIVYQNFLVQHFQNHKQQILKVFF